MKLLDVNLLLYATNPQSPQHDRARTWFDDTMNGVDRLGMPWHTLVGFLRMSTQPESFRPPLSMDTALSFVEEWLEWDAVWVPQPGPDHATILATLLRQTPRSRIVPDAHLAHLAALAIEHGLTLCSADSDFKQFAGLRFLNPLE